MLLEVIKRFYITTKGVFIFASNAFIFVYIQSLCFTPQNVFCQNRDVYLCLHSFYHTRKKVSITYS